MATHKAASLMSPKHMGPWGNANWLYDVCTPTTGALNDIFKLLRIPAGMEVGLLLVKNADLDSNGAPALVVDIGYSPVRSADGPAAVANYWWDNSTMFQAASTAWAISLADPIRFEFDVDVIATVVTGAATFASGAIKTMALGEMHGVK